MHAWWGYDEIVRRGHLIMRRIRFSRDDGTWCNGDNSHLSLVIYIYMYVCMYICIYIVSGLDAAIIRSTSSIKRLKVLSIYRCFSIVLMKPNGESRPYQNDIYIYIRVALWSTRINIYIYISRSIDLMTFPSSSLYTYIVRRGHLIMEISEIKKDGSYLCGYPIIPLVTFIRKLSYWLEQ
jgi:hypothetical protein